MIMVALALDTLQLVKDLKTAGFTEPQAEAVTRAVRQAQDVDLSSLVTKADLRLDLAELKADLLKTIMTVALGQTALVIGAMVAIAKVL
jgi:hypothetical protein